MNIVFRQILRVLVLALLLGAAPVIAQDLEFRPPANASDPGAAAVMRDLAVRVLPVYAEKDPERYLSNLSALQMVAGDFASAQATRQSLRERRQVPNAAPTADRAVIYDVYTRARAMEATTRATFPQSFTRAYREIVPRLNDRDAYTVTRWFGTPLSTMQDTLQRSFDQWRGKGSVPMAQAIDLVWTYLSFEAFRSFAPYVSALDDEENRRRYITDNATIKTADGVTLTAIVIRPRLAEKPLPTLFEFTVYDSQGHAREGASYGFAAVVGFARGVHGGTGRFTPFVTEGEDARTIIAWITKQKWSDGRVGMYGDAFSGYTAWAVAKKPPAALKAIATSDATAPGVDFPMSGNIFRNSAYRWAYQVMREPDEPEDKTFTDEAQWRAFNVSWYKAGTRYREFATSSGRHSTTFRAWLNHPSYDRYWQRMVPQGAELAEINIPVLTTTGYYADSEIGALHYFREHHLHNPRADHTLLIGPYDDGVAQRSTPAALRGYQLDAAAVVEMRDVRYQWFDAVLRGGKRPALLADRVNYQVMGANEWQHAPSIEAMGKGALRFHLQENLNGDLNLLAPQAPAEAAYLPQTYDLADRDDAAWVNTPNIVSRGMKPRNGEIFVSDPVKEVTDVTGVLSGHLDLHVNRMDVDLVVSLFELLPTGDYVLLHEPYELRASYAKERSRRRLLRSGVRQQFDFRSERLAGRRLQAGSRIAVVLGINLRPDRQVNYGTGDDVSEETIDDARIPLRIRWYNSSYIDVPVRSTEAAAGRRNPAGD